MINLQYSSTNYSEDATFLRNKIINVNIRTIPGTGIHTFCSFHWIILSKIFFDVSCFYFDQQYSPCSLLRTHWRKWYLYTFVDPGTDVLLHCLVLHCLSVSQCNVLYGHQNEGTTQQWCDHWIKQALHQNITSVLAGLWSSVKDWTKSPDQGSTFTGTVWYGSGHMCRLDQVQIHSMATACWYI